MKTISLNILAVLFFTTIKAQDINTPINVIPQTFDIVVSFGSVCCGTPSDAFLKTFINSFNTKNKIIINCWQLTGCGREGESKVLFSLLNVKHAKRIRFINAIRKIVPQQDQQNKAVNASSGNINLGYQVLLSSINNCRNAIEKYNLTAN